MLPLLACAEAPAEGRPLPTSGEAVYVWQSAWTPAVRAAVDDARGELRHEARSAFGSERSERGAITGEGGREAGRGEGPPSPREIDGGLALYVLHAEVDRTVRVIAVPAIGPHAAVIRVHDPARLPESEPLIQATARLPDVTELQLDVDVPTARLDAYATWLATLDLPVPLTVTGLPDWLRSPALPAVLDAVDGWTLQLHAPPRREDESVLLDVDLGAVAALGEPYRLALPTYGVGLAQDSEGVTVGVVGEGVRFDGPEVWADPAAVAAVVAAGHADRSFLGLIWFRLPVAGDRWTWSTPTWEAVRAGRAPAGQLVVERADPDLRLRNDGEGDALPTPVDLVGSVTTFDAVAGWTALRTENGVRFTPPTRPVPAHRTVPIGWARGDFQVAR